MQATEAVKEVRDFETTLEDSSLPADVNSPSPREALGASERFRSQEELSSVGSGDCRRVLETVS